MRQFIAVAASVALLMAISEVAVHQFGDRALFVPPQDAVAEGFVREVVTSRYDQAADYLADRPKSLREIRALADLIGSRIGQVDDVQAETISCVEGEAFVSVRLRSANQKGTMTVTTVWKDGQWKVARAQW